MKTTTYKVELKDGTIHVLAGIVQVQYFPAPDPEWDPDEVRFFEANFQYSTWFAQSDIRSIDEADEDD